MVGDVSDVRLSKRVVAARLGISTATLDRWCKTEKFMPGHWMAERRCWWLSEVVGWEREQAAQVTERSRNRNLVNQASEQ